MTIKKAAQVRTELRLPKPLKRRLEKDAAKVPHSLNAEIKQRLWASYANEMPERG